MQYLWNTYSNALLKLDKSSQKYIQKFNGIDDKSNEFSLLKENGFIVYEHLDEFGRICFEEKQSLFTYNADTLSFIIAPGMKCNYNCSYCFESKSDLSGIMQPEVACDVADYICQRLRNNPNARRLRVTWFGGEPLLYVNIVEIISHKLIEFTKQNNIKYYASIITNGRFLNSKTLSKLQEFCVTKAQITVDGMRELYCISKGALPNDFDCVIDNICNAADKIKISVRLNIPNNVDVVKEAIDITNYLFSERGLFGKVHVYLAYVCDYSLFTRRCMESLLRFFAELFQMDRFFVRELWHF